jgi:hypothetical protein
MYRDIHQKLFPLYSIVFLMYLSSLFLIYKNRFKIQFIILLYLVSSIFLGIHYLYKYNIKSSFSFLDSEKSIIDLINKDVENFSILVLPVSKTPLTFTNINNTNYSSF